MYAAFFSASKSAYTNKGGSGSLFSSSPSASESLAARNALPRLRFRCLLFLPVENNIGVYTDPHSLYSRGRYYIHKRASCVLYCLSSVPYGNPYTSRRCNTHCSSPFRVLDRSSEDDD